MVGPNYEAPQIEVSDQWTSASDETEVPLSAWWESLQDPLLDRYIALASESNYTIQIAEANVLRARSIRQVAASGLFPHVNADLNGIKTYFSKNGPVFALGPAAGDPSITTSTATGLPFSLQFPQIQNLFNALFDASWELDLFGKTRRLIESAQASYESAIEQKNDILITVYAEVARNYIDLRSFQKRSQLLAKNIELFEKQEQIVQARLISGYSNQIELETIQAQLAAARAQLPDTHAEIYRSIYTLSILIGHPPETLVDELLEERPLPSAPSHVAMGLRSDLLRRRPDIRSAERELAAATANIGVAVASFFPTITLVADGGFQSLLLPQLFNWGSRTWAYGADINQPIFEGGRLLGTLHLTQAGAAAAAATYQQTVLNALLETENSLKHFHTQAQTTRNLLQDVKHTESVVTITRERYLKGLINLIDLINNKQQLISTQLRLLDSQTRELENVISLYKALGGGWEEGR
jgi:NodT family efflux transporter outer membrane factor (OMF) lipoprotein